jgi:hypothetical protein
MVKLLMRTILGQKMSAKRMIWMMIMIFSRINYFRRMGKEGEAFLNQIKMSFKIS